MITNQNLYAPGRSYYSSLADQFGIESANAVWRAAQTGDQSRLLAALSDARTAARTSTPVDRVSGAYYSGSADGYNNGGTSTVDVLIGQLTTDPFRAPIDTANTQLKRISVDLLKNPLVLLAVGLVVFVALGGWGWLKRKFNP